MMTSRTKLARQCSTLSVLALGTFAPVLAHAHFVQQQPPAYSVQDSLGSPQKSEPCGQADGSPIQPTNMVTTYTQGQTITLTINETVTHPGHYRVSIANKLTDLPADPPVTAGATECGSTVIATSPTLPLVADGLLVHTTAFNGPQSVQVKLPAGLTCTNCTMQITEFMSNHARNNPGGCFYHHCATINIVPAGTPTDGGVVDSSTGPVVTPDLATTTVTEPPPAVATGCSYYLGAAAAPAALYLAGPLVLGLMLRRRRRPNAS